ncbi:TPA: coiled coil protein [Legionella bozemanae]|uniref:coiled coil protein n=1 Tax=Legionella bozemanae TaxID=447 RepID=UPI001041034A|nr:coiled coil protein [Legionella bozemanae]
MPTLNKLKPELKEALGKMGDLVSRYDELVEKSKKESLRDNQDATQYVDDVIKRYNLIKKTSPGSSALQEKKGSFLSLLKGHAAEVGILAFSKPGDLASRLNELDFEPSKIDEITKGMEQAGGDDDLLSLIVSSVVTSETLLTCSDSHHHGHPHASVTSYGFGSHHHGH